MSSAELEAKLLAAEPMAAALESAIRFLSLYGAPTHKETAVLTAYRTAGEQQADTVGGKE